MVLLVLTSPTGASTVAITDERLLDPTGPMGGLKHVIIEWGRGPLRWRALMCAEIERVGTLLDGALFFA